VTVAEKKCSVCDVVKSLDEFYKMTKSPDGRGYTCKPCARARARQWNIDNRDRFNENNRKYWNDHAGERNDQKRQRRASDPEFRASDMERKKREYHANREAELERQRKYRARPEFPAEHHARNALWRENNREHHEEGPTPWKFRTTRSTA